MELSVGGQATDIGPGTLMGPGPAPGEAALPFHREHLRSEGWPRGVSGSQDLCVHQSRECVRLEPGGLPGRKFLGGRSQAAQASEHRALEHCGLRVTGPGGEEEAVVMVAPGLTVLSWAAIPVL